MKTIGLKEVSLKDYPGKNVVLLFYPLDWTPGLIQVHARLR